MKLQIQMGLLAVGLLGLSMATFVACAGECDCESFSNKRVYSVYTEDGEQVTEFSLIITSPEREGGYGGDATVEVVVACPTTDPLVECRFDHPAAPGLWTGQLPTTDRGESRNILVLGRGPWDGQRFEGTLDLHNARLVIGESLGKVCGKTQRQNYSVHDFTISDAGDQ